MTIAQIIESLEMLAPPALQESYDNAGLIVGDKNKACTGILIALDATESIIAEAARKNCNCVITHHPIIFRGLKNLTGKTFVERTVIQAIKNDIAIYAIHTNLDNVLNGVNAKLASVLSLKNLRILFPQTSSVKKLVTFVPQEHSEKVRKALFEAGGGNIGNYEECSFNVSGKGTFKAREGADPFVGNIGERHFENEERIELIFPSFREKLIIKNLIESHPYEEVAYYISPLDNVVNDFGSGMLGELSEAMEEAKFLAMVKTNLKAVVLKHSPLTGRKIRKVAICGGAGFFLLNKAKSSGADAYITADIKFHEFFDAEGDLLLVDAGHYETEQFTVDLLADHLRKYFPNFAVQKTEQQTNPVQYFK